MYIRWGWNEFILIQLCLLNKETLQDNILYTYFSYTLCILLNKIHIHTRMFLFWVKYIKQCILCFMSNIRDFASIILLHTIFTFQVDFRILLLRGKCLCFKPELGGPSLTLAPTFLAQDIPHWWAAFLWEFCLRGASWVWQSRGWKEDCS